MIIDAYATDTVPSHEVRQRANEALANAGEPMSEVTYDALRKRIAELEKAVIQCRLLTKLMKPQADRIAKLEAALKRIEDTDPDEGTPWFHEVARAALEGGKDD